MFAFQLLTVCIQHTFNQLKLNKIPKSVEFLKCLEIVYRVLWVVNVIRHLTT